MRKLTKQELDSLKHQIQLEVRKDKHNNIYIIKSSDSSDETINIGKEIFNNAFKVVGKVKDVTGIKSPSNKNG